jgi:septal ring factor EnvC (AmiA/AmiB activator)
MKTEREILLKHGSGITFSSSGEQLFRTGTFAYEAAIKAMKEYSQQQNKELLEALKRSKDELEYLLNEVRETKPGSYRADTTIRDCNQLIQKYEKA